MSGAVEVGMGGRDPPTDIRADKLTGEGSGRDGRDLENHPRHLSFSENVGVKPDFGGKVVNSMEQCCIILCREGKGYFPR